MEMDNISVEQINLMSLKQQNKSLIVLVEQLKKQSQIQTKNNEKLSLENSLLVKRMQELRQGWSEAIFNLEQTYQMTKKQGENRLFMKFQQIQKFIMQFTDQQVCYEKEDDLNNIVQQKKNFMKDIQNVFTETFIELRRQLEDNSNYIELIMGKEQLQDRMKVLMEQTRNTDKKYREMELKYSSINKQLIELQRDYDQVNSQLNSQTNLINQLNEQMYQLQSNNQLYQFRLYRQLSYNQESVQALINDANVITCICQGQYINKSLQQQQQSSQISQQQQQLSQQHQQSSSQLTQNSSNFNQNNNINNNQNIFINDKNIDKSDQICLQDQYKALLVEYDYKNQEIRQLQQQLDGFQNNLECLFYQSAIFNTFLEQTSKLNEENTKYKYLVKELDVQIKNIENQRQKELDELERITNMKLIKLQNENKQIKLQQNIVQNDGLDIYSHIKPLMERLENSNKSIENIKKDRDQLFEQNKRFIIEINHLKDIKIQLEDSLNQYQIQLTIYKEHNCINYDQLQYKGGKYKEIINQINKIIITNYQQLKIPFDELILYLKTREQKIEYLESKNKQLQKEVKNQQKQQEDLINEIDLTSQNYQEIFNKNRNLIQQIKDQEETFEKLAQEKFKEKSRLEQEKNTLMAKVRVDTELIQNLNNLNLDLEMQISQYQTNAKIQTDLINKYQSQIDELQLKSVQLSQINLDLVLVKDQLKAQNEKQLKQIDEITSHNHDLNLKLRETQNFIERKILLKKSQSVNNHDDNLILQSLEYQQLKQKIICSVCQRNQKKVILQKCSHMFCKECMDKTVAVRNRACPICKNKFGQEDIKEIYFS